MYSTPRPAARSLRTADDPRRRTHHPPVKRRRRPVQRRWSAYGGAKAAINILATIVHQELADDGMYRAA
jgi:NAD(P)-dependent dehydrogenase (short-subunit alcohol dehydrogenase family)